MARTHLRWQFGAWDKPDHAETSKDARHLYMVICADETINQAGVVVLRVGVWADEAAMSDDEVDAAMAELEKRRFVVVDWRRSLLLIRSFIRNDGVYKQPNVLRSALSHASTIKSEVIRRALADELRRLPPKQADKALESGRTFVYPDPHQTAREIDPDGPGGGGCSLAANGTGPATGTPSVKGSPNPSRNPSANPSDSGPAKGSQAADSEPFREPFREPFSEPSVVVVEEVEEEVLPVEAENSAPSELALVPRADAIEPTESQRIQALTAAYVERVPLSKFIAVRGVVSKAVKTGRYSDAAIGAALQRLADDGRSVTTETLRIELEGRPRRSSQRNTDDRVAAALSYLRPEEDTA